MARSQARRPSDGRGSSPWWRSVRSGLVVVAIVVVYALGLQVTQVNLEKPREARRQAQLTNILRGLANPRLVEYQEERVQVEAPVLVPCNPQLQLPPVDTSGRHIEVTPSCLAPGTRATVRGYNFTPGETVYLYFIPAAKSVHEQVELRLADEAIQVDAQGQFSYDVTTKKDRLSDEPQIVRALVKLRSGLPMPSQTLKDTVEKINETIFLALIATTFGTLLAIPISFLAARNLMGHVVSPFGSLMASLVMAPLGGLVGSTVFGWIRDRIGELGASLGLVVLLAILIVCAGLFWLLVRQLRLGRVALPQHDEGDRAGLRRQGNGLGLVLLAAIALAASAKLGVSVGQFLVVPLGVFGFLGNALFVVSDTVDVLLPAVGGLVGLAMLTSRASTLSARFLRAARLPLARAFTAAAAALAGALWAGIIAAGVAWLYEVENAAAFVGIPAAAAGAALLAISLLIDVEHPVGIGMIVYNVTRTILNVLRAIEPLIMVVAFAVWVGIGPFAGVIALALHTIAGLGKLYSEQVESILAGPVEAVTATGANHLQTIVYAVIPQIVPPYLAFTIYRWDINVRMSTIIGFGGGGGIGFLVQQNLNLLKYRDASVQMIAIAIVVATLDYVSAKVREKII
jgi:ABC-type phosphate/phosphonate transport system permease subunit